MAADRESDPSTFDALWDFDLEDGESIPPALDPRGKGGKLPQEKRDTLLPPVPAGEYVDTMMQLGELDDPSSMMARKPAPPPPPTKPRRDTARPGPPAPPKLGLVLAKESELLLPTEDAAPPLDVSEAAIVRAPPRLGAPPPPRPAPRPATNVSSAGLRAPPRPPAPAGLPVPRAPSIPPPGQDPFDAFAALDALGSLDALDALDKPPSSRAPREIAASPSSAPPPRPPPRAPSSDRVGRTTGTGLRLGKTSPPPPNQEGDRVTPIAIEPAPSSSSLSMREMQARFDARNYTGALVLAESVLVSEPHNQEAQRLAESCREMLGQKYLSSLGGKASVPRVCMSPDEMRDLALDHRAGFLLSFIDGSMSIEEVLDVSSMPELDALRMMFDLRQQGAIEIEQPPQRGGRR